MEIDFNFIQLRYVHERFLFRLSKSKYSKAFILKGALLFSAFNLSTLRPTKDIDFLGRHITNDPAEIKDMFKEICSISYDDAVNFDVDNIEVTKITEAKTYPGARIKMPAQIGKARIVIWLDIGFGDKIIPGPVKIDFPTLLDFEAPKIHVYSIESAIAEKFEACVKLNFETSRLKDFYDIHEFAVNHKFKLKILSRALHETFLLRGTDISQCSVIFDKRFKDDAQKEIQWRAFLRRTS
jgi:predicted nucleotidyltransferase component of viral defense system